MTEQDKNELTTCTFNQKNRRDILTELAKREKIAKDLKMYKTLIDEVRHYYMDVEIEYLLKNYEIDSKHYTDESIKNFVTLFIAIGAFAISAFKEYKDINDIIIIFIITLIASILVVVFRAFSPRGSRLNTAIFLLEQAKKLPEPKQPKKLPGPKQPKKTSKR
ncbi:hypothetical protein [Lactococcus lactis]|uniref:hypothetical protein n=1 Tax=Lactococcus lactis TaxID=1358 RepID=UPI0021A50C2E|nr:hypothetical protein [Lactococcus lactis]MCT0052251.1 hypothetical protein [Lactococcus lactis subsp. lactis]